MSNQKGLAPILIVLLIAVVVGGILIYQKQTTNAMIIKGVILDMNSQPFNNPNLTINSVDTTDLCNVGTAGNFTCSARLAKGKTYGIYLNNPKNNTGFVLQYFGGDPGKTLDLGTKKAPWAK